MISFFGKTSVWLLAFLTGLYRIFVVMCYWNWFLVPTFSPHIPNISFVYMIGISTLISLLIGEKTDPSGIDNSKMLQLASTIGETCLPEEKKDAIEKAMEIHLNPCSIEMFFWVIGEIFSNTLMLGLGFLLYTYGDLLLPGFLYILHM